MHNHIYFNRDNSKKMTKSLAFNVIKKVHLTEKSSLLAQKNFLTLVVGNKYNKCDIKKACEILYEQKIADVKIIIKKNRKRAYKGKSYVRSNFKKALIKFKDKDVINSMFGGQQ